MNHRIVKSSIAPLLYALLLIATPARAALIDYVGDFSPASGGVPVSSTLSASLEATWNTETMVFESLHIELSSLPRSTIIGQGLLEIGLSSFNYVFNLPSRPSLASTCCGFYFDGANGLLDYRLDPAFDALATFSTDPVNGFAEIAVARGQLSSGLVDFVIRDVFASASAGLDPTGGPALIASFVPASIAADFPDRIAVDVPAPVPVPAALPLFASGIAGFVLFGLRSRRKPAA